MATTTWVMTPIYTTTRDSPPMFRVERQNRIFTATNSGDRSWGVSAEIDRVGFDRKAFAGLEVVPPPAEVSAMALVMPHEIEQAQQHPERGINTPQRSAAMVSFWRVNPADGIGVRCDPPVARRGQALMVDVHLPESCGLGFAVGLFLYESYWTSTSNDSPSTERYRQVWAAGQPIPVVGTSRVVLRVPVDQAPTHQGWELSTWWDVRPCLGNGVADPSQRSSQPVIIRA